MTKQTSYFPLERFEDIQLRPDDFRLLERIPFTKSEFLQKLPLKLQNAVDGEQTYKVVFLDTETTGLDYKKDKIIELGMVKATYSLDRRIILSIDSVYDAFEDPGMPIPKHIVDITNITDEMVAGQHFNLDEITKILSGRPLIVAHNAAFDRPFFDQRFELLNNLSWACSYSINWDFFGSSGKKLEYLTQSRGWFYDAHRACEDCLALVWLMHIEPDAFSMICDQALSKEYIVIVQGNTFDIKDKLKYLGYRFDGNAKNWYIKVRSTEEVQKQINSISNFYNANMVKFYEITAKTRFKKV